MRVEGQRWKKFDKGKSGGERGDVDGRRDETMEEWKEER